MDNNLKDMTKEQLLDWIAGQLEPKKKHQRLEISKIYYKKSILCSIQDAIRTYQLEIVLGDVICFQGIKSVFLLFLSDFDEAIHDRLESALYDAFLLEAQKNISDYEKSAKKIYKSFKTVLKMYSIKKYDEINGEKSRYTLTLSDL